MKHSARIATLSALLALVCASQAQAARGIRADDGNWGDPCIGTCSWLPGMQLNPVGTVPVDPTSLGDSYVMRSATVQVNYLAAAEYQTTFGAEVPGLSITGGGSQVLFFALGQAQGGFPPETILDPNGNTLFSPDFWNQFDSEGNENPNYNPLAPAGTDAWEVEFNYGLIPEAGASFLWDGFLYTATSNVLSSSTNVFVYFDSALYWPRDWARSPVTASVPEPGTLLLLVAGLGMLLMSRRNRSRSSRQKAAAALVAA